MLIRRTRTIVAATLVALTAAVTAASAASAPATTSGRSTAPFAFPHTAAGAHAAAFFPAINEAGSAALRAFLLAHVSAEGLKRRPVEERLEILGGLREERGRLTPAEIGESEEAMLQVLTNAEDGARLSIRFLCEESPPHALLGIRVEELPDADAEAESERTTPAGPPMTEADVVAALRATTDSLSRAGSFSGAILLAKGAKPLFREAYGMASREKNIANRPDTKFNVGSINKAFTRVAIEILAAEGKLKLTDTIDRYVADYPAELGRKITIAQLLDHRAGVPDFFNERFEKTDKARLREIKDWIPLFRDEPLHFEPGTSEEYSNGGYALLGAVIERVTGTSYYDFVRERIFRPAGMTDTDSYFRDEPVPNRAEGYTRRFGDGATWRNAGDRHPARGSSAGGGYSTVDDLHRYVLALHDGRFGVPSEAGGLAIAGGSPGTNALLVSQGDYTAVVLANLDPPAAERMLGKIRGWLRRAGAGGDGGVTRRIRAGGPRGSGSTAPGPDRASGPDRAPGSTVLPKGGVDTPMLRNGHLPAVQVRVNGQGPFLFAIDTGGAGLARIDSALAARLGLETVGEALGGDPSGKNPRRMRLVAVDSIEIGGATFAKLTAAVRDYNEMPREERVDGILGFGLFANCLLTLDYPADRVRLATGELPAANGADVLDYRNRRGIPSTTIRVAGREIEADVDAGSMGGIILPESEMASLPLASKPVVIGKARTVSNTFEIRAADLDGDVTIGGITIRRPTLEFQPIMPTANLGARVLRDYAITFDQKNERLRMKRPG
jgi:CubicO group peptidase (beta-lactamase class C family)